MNIIVIISENKIYNWYFLSSLIADENEVSYELCYKSSIDGDSPKIFFDKCLSSSPLVFLIETYQGYRFGVYISVFLGDNLDEDKYIRDDNAFIFSLNTFKKYKIIQKDYAIFFRKDKFPWFGKKAIISWGFSISLSKFGIQSSKWKGYPL